jgi:hypothetical protein
MAETMVAKHTPEPWAYEDGTVYAVQGDERQPRVSKDGRPFIYHTGMIALVYSRNGGSQEANGRLMAEAPEMYKLLLGALVYLDSHAAMTAEELRGLGGGDTGDVILADRIRALQKRLETPMG